MLRLVFASALLLIGAVNALRGPFYALLLYLFIAYFRPDTWIWTRELRSLNVSLIVGVFAVMYTAGSRDRFRLTGPMWLVVLFCLHGFVSTIVSENWAWCIFWWQGFAKAAVITILIMGLVTTRERMRITLIVIAFALGFEAVKQGWFHLLTAQDEMNLNPIEILGDNNGVAVGMLMLAAVLLALLQTTKRLWLKSLYGFMIVGVIFRSVTSYSRGGFLAFGAMGLTYLSQSKHRFRTMLLVGGLLVPLSLLPSTYWERIDTITSEEQIDTSVLGRRHFWEVARIMANDHPILGVGTSGFQAFYNRYDTSSGAFGFGRAVHSMWFGILAEQGYVGFFMFCTILLMAMWACHKARSDTKAASDRDELFVFAGALQTALVAVAVGGSFLSYQYVEVLWHFIGLSFAARRIAALEPVLDAAEVRVPIAPQPLYQVS
jgi:probable O-glycosylation ligase (exosortase A-associated)